MKLSSALAALALFGCSGEKKPYDACVQKEDVCSNDSQLIDCVASCKPNELYGDEKCPNGYALEKTSNSPTNDSCYGMIPTEL